MDITSSLTLADANHVLALKEFFAVGKSNRSKKTYKGTLSHFETNGLQVWITIHQLSLWKDNLYVGKDYLRRGHIIEKHYIKLPNGSVIHHYQDYGAHPKFANLNQRGFPDAQRDSLEKITDHRGVYLFEKESGSMCIAVFPPRYIHIFNDQNKVADNEVIYRSDNFWATQDGSWHVTSHFKDETGSQLYTGMTPQHTYEHTHEVYVTSKNGWDNPYAKAGAVALTECLAKNNQTIAKLRNHLHNRERSTIVFELMQHEEHVYTDREEQLYVHLVDHTSTPNLSLMIGQFLPVVKRIGDYPSVSAALEQWESDNEECNHQKEGYVLVIARSNAPEIKVKLKFWKYLVLREMRETIKRHVCPTVEFLHTSYAMWHVPAHLWAFYTRKCREWWWWINSPQCTPEQRSMLDSGRYIELRDYFMTTDIMPHRTAVAEREPLMLYVVLTGVQCSGKSRVREELLKQFPGFARSQDDCGGDRKNLIAEINKWATNCTEPGVYMTIIDRCNLNWEQRRTLYNDLETVERLGYITTINVGSGDVTLPELFQRFLNRQGHPSFSKETVGCIHGYEIIQESLAAYTKSPDSGSSPVPVDLHPTSQMWNKYGTYNRKKNKSQFVYGGIVYPQSLLNYSVVGWGDDSNVQYGTHCTLVYGKGRDPLPEGVPVTVKVVGRYVSPTVYGLLVQVPGYTELKHITMETCQDTPPARSNAVLEQIFGRKPTQDDVKTPRQVYLKINHHHVEWFKEPEDLEGYYGNYYR